MPITYEELMESRETDVSATEKTLIRVFMIYGTDDPDEAANIGPQIGEFWDDERQVVDRHFDPPIKPGAAGTEEGVLRLTVTYRYRIIKPVGAPSEFAIRIGSQTERVYKTPPQQTLYGVAYNALSQDHYGAPGATDTDEPGDLINVVIDENGRKAEGADVLVPSMGMTETHQRSSFPVAYQKTLTRLVAKVNDREWRGWPAGTLLFLGVDASKRKGEQWRITYNFSIGINAVIILAVDTGDSVTITKDAHAYLWFRSSLVDDGAGNLESKIHDAHVANVYQPANFNELGIGDEELS